MNQIQQSKHLKNWAKITVENTQTNLTKSLFDAILLNSKSFDTFSSWFLLVTGAIFTLLIPNFETIKNMIDSFAITLFLFLMIASAIFGVIAKYYSITIEVLYNMSKTLEKDFPQILADFNSEKEKIEEVAQGNKEIVNVNIDLKKVMLPLIQQFPRIYHRFLWKSFEDGKKDSLINHKKGIKYLLSRSFYATIQIMLFIAALIIFIKNINL